MAKRRYGLGFLAALLVVGACGHDSHGSSGDDAKAPARTIDVEMSEFAYAPTTVAVQAGETVKFVFHNAGLIIHDAFIGDEAAQAKHEKDMRSGDMDKAHHGDDGVTVEPGKTGSLTHTFERAGTLLIGCHQPAHYQAGMKLNITAA